MAVGGAMLAVLPQLYATSRQLYLSVALCLFFLIFAPLTYVVVLTGHFYAQYKEDEARANDTIITLPAVDPDAVPQQDDILTNNTDSD